MAADIRLLVTDLDGTFLRSNRTFDATLFAEVLQKAQAKGIHIAIASGRHQYNIEQLFKEFAQYPLHKVSNNGAKVTHADGRLLHEVAIPAPILPEIVQVFDDFTVKTTRGYILTTDRAAYMPRSIKNWLLVKTPPFRQFFETAHLISDVAQIQEPILKVTAGFPRAIQNQFVDFARERLGNRVHITDTGTGAIDIVASDVNKATGLQALMAELGLHKDQVAAFGDGGNDLEMLGYVGHPYRMPNSAANVAAHTEFIEALADNNHNGVMQTMLHLIEQQA